jgi:hypothetical protein
LAERATCRKRPRALSTIICRLEKQPDKEKQRRADDRSIFGKKADDLIMKGEIALLNTLVKKKKEKKGSSPGKSGEEPWW